RAVASQHDLAATFMAKPYEVQPGCGLHFHVSLCDAQGGNIFDSGQSDLVAPELRAAAGGLVHTARDLQLAFTPLENSMRRLAPNTHAPLAATWAQEHRGAAIRLPAVHGKDARLEHRISGADANPYLALTAILGGLLHGLETQLEPGPALRADGVQREIDPDDPTALTHDRLTACQRFARSAHARDIFGAPFAKVFADVKAHEARTCLRTVPALDYLSVLPRI
ncbi:MAG: glutamine synthetase, partial [Pseudomonadota bacterium]